MDQSELQADQDMVNFSHKKRKAIWFWITLSLIGAAGIAAALCFTVFAPQGAAARPYYELLTRGSEVILVRSSETVSLGNAEYHDTSGICLNSVRVNNGSLLFYLCDIDKGAGEGTLMKVETTGSSPPVEIAQDVCIASVSDDGRRVLYITNMDKTGGDLMLTDGGKTERVAEDVVPDHIEFSKNGEYFSFLQVDETSEGYKFTVFTGRSAEDIKITDEFVSGSYNSKHYTFEADVLNNGTLVYIISALNLAGTNMSNETGTFNLTDMEFRTCACEYGKSPDKLTENGHPEWTNGRAYLYTADHTLYYVDEKGNKESVISDFRFTSNVYDENGRIMEDSLMLIQEGDSEDTVNVYSLTLGQDAEKICEADFHPNGATVGIDADAGPGFKYVSYKQDGELFISVRDKDGWSEGISMGSELFSGKFEDSRRYFYFIARENKADRKGDLYRYDMATGDKKKLQSDVTDFELAGDTVCTEDKIDSEVYYIAPDGKVTLIAEDAWVPLTGDGGVYIQKRAGGVYCIAPDGRNTLIAEGSGWLGEGNGGVYIERWVDGSFSLLFVPSGGGDANEVVSKYDDRISVTWDIEYQMPLPADVK